MSRYTLDGKALAHNLALAREWAPEGARVRAMVVLRRAVECRASCPCFVLGALRS